MIVQCKKEIPKAITIVWAIVSILLLSEITLTSAVEDRSLSIGPEHVHVISGGYTSTNRVYIAVGDHVFYEDIPSCTGTAGLYVVAVKENQVLLHEQYNTYLFEGASEGMARDIEELPEGTLVIVAAKDEPTRHFDTQGQEALISIGASAGLLGQSFRTSYLCVGIKGSEIGMAIEGVGFDEQQYTGSLAGISMELVFPEPQEPIFSSEPGIHEGLLIGETEVPYYIPAFFDPNTAQYLFGIHGAGSWHRPGAMNRIHQFRAIADIENLVIIAPAFDAIFNWSLDDQGLLVRGSVMDLYLGDFICLINKTNHHRTDLKLIEILDFFNKHLMKREKFHLYGHSGGGQFVSRFMLFYPHLLDKVAISSAGSYVFPEFHRDYPYGVRLDQLMNTFGPQIQANDLMLNSRQVHQRLFEMVELGLIIVVGEHDTAFDDRPERNWQGANRLEKAENYIVAMEELHAGYSQPRRQSRSPFNYSLYVMPGVGHASNHGAAFAIKHLFPIQEQSKGDILVLDFENVISDSSSYHHVVQTESPPSISQGTATFGPGLHQYLHTNLHQNSCLTGCTQMTIHVRVRMDPNPKRHAHARLIQTSNNQWWGTALAVQETSRIRAWIQTTAAKATAPAEDKNPIWGRSPSILSEKTLDDKQWHDIVLTYNGQEVALLIDQEWQERIPWQGALINAHEINVGYVQSNGFHFDGDIDIIEICGQAELRD